MWGHFIAPTNLDLFACLHQDTMLTHASICSEWFKDSYTKNALIEEKKSQNEDRFILYINLFHFTH